MAYSNRIWLYGPFGLLLLLAVLYSVFWRVQADMLAARLDRANGGEIVPGIVFAFAEKSIGGYPFRLDAVLSGVTLSHAGPNGQTAWRSEKLALHALTYGRDLYILEAAGRQTFEQPGDSGAPMRVVSLNPAVARASAILSGRRLARFDLDLWQPEAKDATQGAEPSRTLSAGRAQLHLLAHPDDTADIAMRIEEAKIGEGLRPMLGGELSLVDLRGKLSKTGTLSALATGSEDPTEAAEQWREAGGRLTVENLTLDWAGIKTALTGSIGLDTNHRPEGTLLGSFDAAKLIGALTHGGINLPSMGERKFSLLFKDGDIKLGADSTLLGPAH